MNTTRARQWCWKKGVCVYQKWVIQTGRWTCTGCECVIGGKCVMEEKSGDVGWDHCAVPGMADSSLGHDLIRAWEKLKVF